MAVLYSYPIKSTPANRDDLVVISDSRDGNKTKQIAVANLPGSASFSGIGGSGTVGYIPKFSTSTDLVNSVIYGSDTSVGIGTTTPSSKLTIVDAVDRDMNSGGSGQFQIGGDGYQFAIAMGATGAALYHNSNQRSLILGTNELSRLTILGDGNIGIGTTSPSKKLDVNGDVTFGTGNKFQTEVNAMVGLGANGVVLRSAVSTAANPSFSNNDDQNTGMFLPGSDVLGLSTAGLERMRIISSGNVGIGTTSPDSILTVKAATANVGIPVIKSSVNGFANGFTLIGDNYAVGESQFNLGISFSGVNGVLSRGVKVSNTTNNVFLSSQDNYATRPNAFVLGSDGSFRFLNTSTNANTAVGTAVSLNERIRITSSGNVGIGNANPNEKLVVSGRVKITGTGPFITSTRNPSSQSNYIRFFDNEAAADEAYVGFTSSNKDLKFNSLSSTGTISMQTAGSTALSITNSQNVGIGTTSPSNKLTVGTLGSETSIACASTGFDSLRLGTLTFPSAAGYYRVAQYTVASARGGARIDLCITGGAFAPVTYSIDYFKSYTQAGTEHTLKLEQYGGANFITKARIAFSGSSTFIEVYKNATTDGSGNPITMPTQVHFNRLIGESGGSLPLFGTPASGSASTSLKEVEFIRKGTSVESLRVQGGNLNLKNLPTAASGLAVGDVYNDGGTLKIVL